MFAGYGDIVPITWKGQIFVSIYAAIGIPLNVIFLADVGYLFAKLIVKVIKPLNCTKYGEGEPKKQGECFKQEKQSQSLNSDAEKNMQNAEKNLNIFKSTGQEERWQRQKVALSASSGMSIHARSVLRSDHDDDNVKDTSFTKENHIATANGEQDSFESVTPTFPKAQTNSGCST